MLYKDETYKIIGACMKVHRNLGPGFLENVYSEALSLEFEKEQIPFEREKKLKVQYEDTTLNKYYRADFICYNSIIVELKALKYLSNKEIAITQNYLKATNQPVGLLVAFGAPSLLYKRIYNNSHPLLSHNLQNEQNNHENQVNQANQVINQEKSSYMKILVTGAKGFVGKNLVAQLYNIKDGKAKFYGDIQIDVIYEYDIDSTQEELDAFCKDADFVFNLAGVNRPKEQSEFMEGNFGFASTLLDMLKKHGNTCPIMLSSSIQATLQGRFGESEYGKSKKAGEDLFFDYSKETGAKVLVYRFPNLFGKWCKPNYNSAVATFCNNIANDLPIQVNDPTTELELLYIDDLVNEMIAALSGKEHHCEFEGVSTVLKSDGRFCCVPTTHKVTLGEIVELLNKFNEQPKTLLIPEIPNNSFAKKLYSTYLSYLPKEKVAFPLKMNIDNRGSFTELLKSEKCGQVSINISKPGITKGQHWHNSKWEFFMVVSGKGLIQMRKVVSDNKEEVFEFHVSGEKIEAVHMLPGYTHNIINLSDTEDLVTVMWANEAFDPNYPDTYFEPVK